MTLGLDRVCVTTVFIERTRLNNKLNKSVNMWVSPKYMYVLHRETSIDFQREPFELLQIPESGLPSCILHLLMMFSSRMNFILCSCTRKWMSWKSVLKASLWRGFVNKCIVVLLIVNCCSVCKVWARGLWVVGHVESVYQLVVWVAPVKEYMVYFM